MLSATLRAPWSKIIPPFFSPSSWLPAPTLGTCLASFASCKSQLRRIPKPAHVGETPLPLPPQSLVAICLEAPVILLIIYYLLIWSFLYLLSPQLDFEHLKGKNHVLLAFKFPFPRILFGS